MARTAAPKAARQNAHAALLPVRRLVIPVGGMDREFLAQEQAVQFAAVLGVPIAAVHVSAAPDREPGDLFRYIQEQAGKRDVEIECLTLAGTDAAAVILDELDALDLLLVGTERMGDRFHVGGVADRLIRKAPGPVQVVRLGSYDEEASPAQRRRAYQ